MFEVCALVGGEFYPIIDATDMDDAISKSIGILDMIGYETQTLIREKVAA